MIEEIKTYKTADLVLQVNTNYDPAKLSLRPWERWLDILCTNRSYQKEAIQRAVVFLASGLYADINALVEENWCNQKNTELRNRYQNMNAYLDKLQIPGKLSCTLDLATGTGKSYVMYGIAQIMLGLGLVDKVLVLCPSITIEEGLTEKFRTLAQDSLLLKAIPEVSKIKNPSIKNADVTIKVGDICIENIHAVYETTGSSIKDSLAGEGAKILVLNDEAHHIYNKIEGRGRENQGLKKWKEFLIDPLYDFKYIAGFTGTAYIDDEYFNDCIYRYSLRQAVSDVMIKTVEYISKNDDADSDNIKFQEIYDNHVQNKITYRKIKPLTIFVTKDITNAKQLLAEFLDFLTKKEELKIEESEKKTLIVTSANEHRANVRMLKEVDDKENSVEWVFSVSMLTEGWDVKNVFQIVPWEDRAFNSKLLIAQVLGRGLRLPLEYQSPQTKVRVFNHDAWSVRIRTLVDEILEIEMRLVSSPLQNSLRAAHHFELYNIKYDHKPRPKPSSKKHEVFDYKGYIVLQSQSDTEEKKTEYRDLQDQVSTKKTLVEYNTVTVDEIVNNILAQLRDREWEGKLLKLSGTEYSKRNPPTREALTKLIYTSMKKAGIEGDGLIEKNKIKIENSFNTLLRKTGKTVFYEWEHKDPVKYLTANMEKESLSVGNLRRGSCVFYSSDFGKELKSENLDIFNTFLRDDDFKINSRKEENVYLFKTPLDLVFTTAEPERRFVEALCEDKNADAIVAWVKSRGTSFYEIEYSIKSVGGKHSKIQIFNPDFFIKLSKDDFDYIVVIEIKSDDDISDENIAKRKYARQHFDDLNTVLSENKINQKYSFHFLSPHSFSTFFEYLRDGKLFTDEFVSELDSLLEAAISDA